MKKIATILISLFILVIGISCISAVDLNTHSVANDAVANANIGSGDLSAPAVIVKEEASLGQSSIIPKRDPDLWLSSNSNTEQLGQSSIIPKRDPDLWLSSNCKTEQLGQASTAPKKQFGQSLATKHKRPQLGQASTAPKKQFG